MASLLLGQWNLQNVRADSPSWIAGWIHPGTDGAPTLTLFPMTGQKMTVVLPRELPSALTVDGFSVDGRAIYVQRAAEPTEGIIKIGFNPMRQATLPGSMGLGTIWHLVELAGGSELVVSGISTNPRECGTFDIDPNGGVLKTILSGAYPGCGGGGGAISPDGKRVARYADHKMILTDLKTRAVYVVGGIESKISEGDPAWFRKVTWSPNGRWISAVTDDDKILLIDSDLPDRHKNLGSSGGALVSWSPDSKYLLLSKSELRCSLYLYFESLEVLDVETGRRSVIKSSRCEVGLGWVGWLDAADVESSMWPASGPIYMVRQKKSWVDSGSGSLPSE